MARSIFRKYLLPGLIFQSVVIGGGYGTGRELVEFFLTTGPVDGYLGMLLATIIWSITLAVTFELARTLRRYDYRSFLKELLGRGWVIYEVVYVAGLILVVSVLGSAASELLHDLLGLPAIAGSLVVMGAVGFFVFFGTGLIEKVLSLWSLALYGVFLILIIASLVTFGEAIKSNLGLFNGGTGWVLGGIKYSAYNIGIVPAILFGARHIETRREALGAGLLGGVIAMLPGVFIYTAMLAHYPAIVSEAVPATYLLAQLGSPALRVVFQVVLVGTFIETGIGLIHGFNERVAGNLLDRGTQMGSMLRSGIGLGILVLALFVANAVGLVDLIARGYGTLTWGYWIVYLLPVLTVGVWKIISAQGATASQDSSP